MSAKPLQRIWEIIEIPVLYILAIFISPVIAYLFLLFALKSFIFLDKLFN